MKLHIRESLESYKIVLLLYDALQSTVMLW